MGKRYGQVTLEERCEMARLQAAGQSVRQFAAALDRAPSTVARELKRNRAPAGEDKPVYAAQQAQARRWRGARLERDETLRAQALGQFPPAWRRTVPCENGTECALHSRLHELGIEPFFCDIPSPWQKGGVENAIGWLRRTLPRKTDLAAVPQERFTQLIQAYNTTPHKCLAYRTPAEIFLDRALHLKCESTCPLSPE